MRQQINLYQPIFSEARKPLSAGIAALGLLLVIGGLAGYAFYANAGLAGLRAEIDALRAAQAEQAALIEATDAQQAGQTIEAIQAKIKDLQHAVSERTAALKVLQSGAAGQTSGFAARMEALARRHVEGLWIDKLMMSGTNGTMTLGGATLDADTVPVYLHSLARESVLSGTRFDEFVIERPQKRDASVAETDADGKPIVAKPFVPGHIRFRAGSKSLAPANVATEEPT